MEIMDMLGKKEFVVLGYFTSWSIYNRAFFISDIDTRGLTHISYAFARVKDGSPVLGDPWADLSISNSTCHFPEPDIPLMGNYLKLIQLKEKHPEIQIGLSIGGWGINDFSDSALTEHSRKRFAERTAEMVERFGFDYVDIDWEFPGSGPEGMRRRQEDRQNYVLLLKKLKETVKKDITIALPCSNILQHFDLKAMEPYVTFFNLMGYDMTGSWSKLVDHHANLYPRTPSSSSIASIMNIILKVIPPSKIILGIPMYGKAFESCGGFLQNSFKGPATNIDFRLILEDPNYIYFYEQKTNGTIAYDPKALKIISFDNKKTVTEKCKFIRRNGLGGAMLWELSQDLPMSHPESIRWTIYEWFGGNLKKSIPLKAHSQ